MPLRTRGHDDDDLRTGDVLARLAISLDAELARAVRRAAGKQPTSTWIAEAAQQRLRAEGLRKVVAEYELAHGTFSDDEITAVLRREQNAIASAKRAAKRRRR